MTKPPDQSPAARHRSTGPGFHLSFRQYNDCFDSYGCLLICCFALVGATSRDASLRQRARARPKNSPTLAPCVFPCTTRCQPGSGPRFCLVATAKPPGLRDVALNAQYALPLNVFSSDCWASTQSASLLRMTVYACDCA